MSVLVCLVILLLAYSGFVLFVVNTTTKLEPLLKLLGPWNDALALVKPALLVFAALGPAAGGIYFVMRFLRDAYFHDK